MRELGFDGGNVLEPGCGSGNFIGFAPDGAFDATIGNVPSGNYWLYDPHYNSSQRSIHNHFISKNLDMTKPGRIV